MGPGRRDDGRTIYNRLAQVRTERGLSRAQLADSIGVNVQTVGALERGQYYPSLYVAMLIEQACETPIQTVFSWVPWPGEPTTNGALETHPVVDQARR